MITLIGVIVDAFASVAGPQWSRVDVDRGTAVVDAKGGVLA